MRYLLIALLLACASASAQTANEKPLSADKPSAPSTNEKPASVDKSKVQDAIDADQKFIESAVKSAGSKEAAARIEISRGWKQLKQGDTEVAIESFTRAYKLDPKNVEVHWGMGNAMTRQGKYAAASAFYERATTIDPQNAKLMADVGLSQTYSAFKSTQDPEKQVARVKDAMQWFDSAEKIDPNRPEIYANRAISLYVLKNYDEAWKNVGKAEALERNSVDPQFLADLTAKLARPDSVKFTSNGEVAVKTEAVTTPPAVQKVERKDTGSGEQSAIPTTKLSPTIRDDAGVKNQPEPKATSAAPTVKPEEKTEAQAQKDAPVAAPVKETKDTPIATEKAKDVAPDEAPAEKVAAPTGEQEQTPAAKEKRVELIEDKTLPQIGADKRNCLELKTNDEIHRCVYPKK